MKKTILSFTLLFIIMIESNAQDLRAPLASIYKEFSDAMRSKDGAKLKSVMSSSAYTSVRNNIVSSGSKFPDVLFESVDDVLVDMTTLTFIKVIVKGPIAFSYYYGKQYDSDMLFNFKYVQEKNVWKFDLIAMKSSDKISKSIKAKDFSFLSDAEFQPDGIMPVVPKEVVMGDYVGYVDLMAGSYEMKVSINGNLAAETTKGSYSSIVLGGLKKGKNVIVINSKLKKEEEISDITVTIRAVINGKDKTVFTLKEGDPIGTITKEFIIE